MTEITYLFSIFIFFIVFYHGIELLKGYRKITYLINSNSPLKSKPKVSIIIPARNEAQKIKPALLSILQQDYTNYEVILINDRSTDNTLNIIKEFEESYSKLKIFTVNKLPENYLGKSNALQLGAANSEGELLLFTDADVIMKKDTLSKAVSYLNEFNLDHLTASPKLNFPNWYLRFLGTIFIIHFTLYAKPYKIYQPKSKYYIGIGAFNLLKRDVYNLIGGHSKISMRPDDDMQLGKLMKANGFKQEFLQGLGLIEVNWYSSVREMTEGFMKNSYASLNFNIFFGIAAVFTMLLFEVFPFILVFYFDGPPKVLMLLTFHFFFILYSKSAKFSGANKLLAGLYPIGVIHFIFIFAKSIILTLLLGGVYWRNTFYPLSKLKTRPFNS